MERVITEVTLLYIAVIDCELKTNFPIIFLLDTDGQYLSYFSSNNFVYLIYIVVVVLDVAIDA